MLRRALRLTYAVTALLLAAVAPAAAQDFRAGLRAFNSGDFLTAISIWTALAERGDAPSQAGLGFMLHKGLGGIADDKEAAYWLQKAAEQEQAEGQYLLGTLYFYGKGVPQSYVMAFVWCDLAVTNGQSDAEMCRNTTLDHMTAGEIRESMRLVSEWRRFQQGRRR